MISTFYFVLRIVGTFLFEIVVIISTYIFLLIQNKNMAEDFVVEIVFF